MKKKIIYGVLALLLISQFFPIDKTNPPAPESSDFLAIHNAPGEVSLLVKNACYDCHSNQSEYPWYTNISPISFWIRGHIRGARQRINFSEWNRLDASRLTYEIQECIEAIEDGRMPAKSFVLMHPEAKLSSVEKQRLVTWMRSQL